MSKGRFASIAAIVTDVDGVLTDGRVLIGAGTESKYFSIRDGLAMKAAIEAGYRLALLTGRHSESVISRAGELGIEIVKSGRLDKQAAFAEIVAEIGLAQDQIAYVGDDLPDLAPMTMAGWSFCPSDAAEDVKLRADVVVPVRGGFGVLRWIIESMMRERGQWDAVVGEFEVRNA